MKQIPSGSGNECQKSIVPPKSEKNEENGEANLLPAETNISNVVAVVVVVVEKLCMDCSIPHNL